MIRPWYRSRLFWLGVPGLLFLIWGWRQSNLRGVEIYWGPGWIYSWYGELMWHDSPLPWGLAMMDPSESRSTRIENADGPYEEFGPVKYEVAPSARGDATITTVDPADTCWFPPPRWQMRQDPNGEDFRLCSVPYWLPAGAYVGVWFGGLAAWQRRKARLVRASAFPPP